MLDAHKEISISIIKELVPIIKNTVSFKRRFIHETINSLIEVISIVSKYNETENKSNADFIKILNLYQNASTNILLCRELEVFKDGFFYNIERRLYTGRTELRKLLKTSRGL